MKVLVTRRMTEAAETLIGGRFDARFRDSEIPLNVDEAAAALGEYDAIIPTLGDAFTADAFARAGKPRTRLLANFGAGFNHIDVAAARAAGIAVTNTPDVVTDATADLAVTLLMMAARRAGEGERIIRAGNWQGWAPTQLLGSHVSGKTVGIVGMGRIGRAIAKRLHHGFGMRVVFHNRSRLSSLEIPATQLGSLEDVLEAADFTVLSVPGGVGTYHMIGAAQLARMPRHAILVNVARGDVMDEAAMINALQQGQIRAAGLDVYEREPEVSAELLAMENVVLLPHLGTAVEETRTEMALRAMKNIVALSEDRTPGDLVN